MSSKLTIGFIGQGYVGKNYADYFESRGFKTVRYSLEEPYIRNKDLMPECDIVFIGVPTPTTPRGFDDSIVRKAVRLVGDGKIAVIKSTILPGRTISIQKENPKKIVIFSPEFLSERTAKHDVEHPFVNMIGLPQKKKKYTDAARTLISILPKAPQDIVSTSTEAEIFKYCHNGSAYTQIVFFNMMYELTRALKADWNVVYEAIQSDSLIAKRYSNPFDKKGGRGAGGHCFIKDFAAIRELTQKLGHDSVGLSVLRAQEAKNNELLSTTGKDTDLLEGVYGKKVLKKRK
jgi:UDP-glucose 6-dehydrogenase